MRALSLALVLALGHAPPGPTSHRSVVAFELPERDLFPESIAHDPADGAFYVGSMHKRKVVRIAAGGEVSDFVPSKRDGLWTVIGMKIDPKRRELWAATCNLGPGQRPPMIDPDPATAGQTAVHRYDLRTAELVRRYEPQDPPSALCFNDLVLARNGDVYLSSGPGGVWRIAHDADEARLFTPAEGMLGNGIAISKDDATLYLAVHDKGIVGIDVATKAIAPLPAPTDPHVMGIDGLYVHGDALIGIQNGTKTHRVLRATLAAGGKAIDRVEILEEAHPRFDVPTTGVLVGDDLYYVATSQLDRIDPETNAIFALDDLLPNVILELPLASEAGPESAPAAPPVAPAVSDGGCAHRR